MPRNKPRRPTRASPTAELSNRASKKERNIAKDHKKAETNPKNKTSLELGFTAPSTEPKPWWESWEETEHLRTHQGNSLSSDAERVYQATMAFNKDRKWPSQITQVRALWDRFQVFIGTLTNAAGDEHIKLKEFVDNPCKVIQIYLSSFMSKSGSQGSGYKVDMIPRLLRFYVKFLLRNHVLPPQREDSLNSALEIIERAQVELPLIIESARTIPDEWNLACKECFTRETKIDSRFTEPLDDSSNTPKTVVKKEDIEPKIGQDQVPSSVRADWGSASDSSESVQGWGTGESEVKSHGWGSFADNGWGEISTRPSANRGDWTPKIVVKKEGIEPKINPNQAPSSVRADWGSASGSSESVQGWGTGEGEVKSHGWGSSTADSGWGEISTPPSANRGDWTLKVVVKKEGIEPKINPNQAPSPVRADWGSASSSSESVQGWDAGESEVKSLSWGNSWDLPSIAEGGWGKPEIGTTTSANCGDWTTASLSSTWGSWGREPSQEVESKWTPPEPPSLHKFLGPTSFPFTHSAGISEWSVRRVKSIHPPISLSSDDDHLDTSKTTSAAVAIEHAIESQLWKVVLTPWPVAEWSDLKSGRELLDEIPRVLNSSKGRIIKNDGMVVEDGADIETYTGSLKPHDPLLDDITVLLEEDSVKTIRTGMGLGGTWVQLLRNEDLDVNSEGVIKTVDEGPLEARFWFIDHLLRTLTSYYIV